MIKKRNSQIIKALTLLMMIYCHFFGEVYYHLFNGLFFNVYTANHSLQQSIAKLYTICVSILSFISGYDLFIVYKNRSVKQNIKYLFKKTIYLLIIYETVLILFFVPLELFFNKSISLNDLLLNTFLLDNELIASSWYVLYYIEACFTLLFYHYLSTKYIKKNNVLFEIVLIVLLNILLYVICGYSRFQHYIISFMLGYIYNKYFLFDLLNLKKSIIILILLFTVRIIIGDSLYCVSITAFITIPFIYILNFFLNKYNIDCKALFFVSKYSTFYWLLHCVFIRYTRLRDFVCLPKFSILILVFSILLLLPFAIVFKKISDSINKIIDIKE